jgi:ribosomal protein S27AE
MSGARGSGIYMRRGQYGTIDKCPRPGCEAANITKVHPDQLTCGKLGCREWLQKKNSRERNAAKRRRIKDLGESDPKHSQGGSFLSRLTFDARRR